MKLRPAIQGIPIVSKYSGDTLWPLLFMKSPGPARSPAQAIVIFTPVPRIRPRDAAPADSTSGQRTRAVEQTLPQCDRLFRFVLSHIGIDAERHRCDRESKPAFNSPAAAA